MYGGRTWSIDFEYCLENNANVKEDGMEYFMHGFLFAIGVLTGILVMPTKDKKESEIVKEILIEKNKILRDIHVALIKKG